MAESNFMLKDVASTLLGFLLFPTILIMPGYIVCWSLNLFDFRLRLLHSRLALSLLISIAITPILFYLLASLFSFSVVFIVLALCLVVFIVLVFIDRPSFSSFHNKTMIWAVTCALVWILISLFSLVDLQNGHELFFSVVAFDQTTRISLVDAMTRTGIPPANPSFYPGRPVQLNLLYFFWYIFGSIIDQIGGSQVDARGAFFASTIWCGIALMAVIAFYLRLRNKTNGANIWLLVLMGVGLLLVTGLDVLPVSLAIGFVPLGDIEHWNEQITAWVGSLLWVPHHVAAMIACLVGVMLALSMRRQTIARQYVLMTIAGVSFASAFGLSVWVTLVFVIFWGIWMGVSFLLGKDREVVVPLLFAGVIAFVLSYKFLAGVLAGIHGNGEPGGWLPIIFGVRSFLPLDTFTSSYSKIIQTAFRLVFLPLNYFLELGFFFLAGVIWVRQRRKELSQDQYYLMETILLGTALFVGTFMRSTLLNTNDLGWRAWLPGQFVLLIWGVDVLTQFLQSSQVRARISPRIKFYLTLLVVLGIVTTLLDLYLLRSFYYVTFGDEAGAQTYSARMAYQAVNQSLPEDAIIQYNPVKFIDRPSGLYGMHQSAISDRTAYGIPRNVYDAKVVAIRVIFDMENVSGWQAIDSLCQQNFIDALVLTSDDKLWQSLNVLEPERHSLYIDENYAVFTCGNYAGFSLP
ncbi:MAG: hypothetical protein ABI904_08215 [Chloroflexota bacterium]